MMIFNIFINLFMDVVILDCLKMHIKLEARGKESSKLYLNYMKFLIIKELLFMDYLWQQRIEKTKGKIKMKLSLSYFGYFTLGIKKYNG